MDKIVYDAETNEETIVPLSEEDLILGSIFEQEKQAYLDSLTLDEPDPNKVSALVKLQSLGLTTDEAKAIVGL